MSSVSSDLARLGSSVSEDQLYDLILDLLGQFKIERIDEEIFCKSIIEDIIIPSMEDAYNESTWHK